LLIQNLPNFNFYNKTISDSNNSDKDIQLIYVGTINRNRQIKEILLAIENIDGLIFTLIGEWEDLGYKKECEQLIGYKKTNYIGKIPYNKMPSYINSADIGLCVLSPTFNHLNSLPVKLLEYFYFELPVIASNFSYWVNEFDKACIYVSPTNIEEIKNAIIYLKENPNQRKVLGNEGKNYLKDKYNWELEKKKMLEQYKILMK